MSRPENSHGGQTILSQRVRVTYKDGTVAVVFLGNIGAGAAGAALDTAASAHGGVANLQELLESS